MTAKPCLICGTTLDGWVYDYKSYVDKYNDIQPHIVGFKCASCGAVVCAYKHDKQLHASPFTGLTKVTCPTCGKPFGLPSVITGREVAKLNPLDKPSSNLETWANIFIDTHNGERLISARDFDGFRLILTDRRLIYLPGGGSASAAALANQDLFNTVIPLRNIASVKINKTITGASNLVVDTKIGESHKFASKGPLDNFGQRLQEAIPNSPPAVIFPVGEKVFYDGDNLGFLWTDYQPTQLGAEIHNTRFYSTLRVALAVTNCRMFFYRVTHIAEREGGFGGVSVKFGEPAISFISIPWEAIRRISIDTSFMSKSVNLVLAAPVWGFMTRWLHVYPYNEITVEELRHTCSKCGGTIMGGIGMQRKDLRGMTIDKAQTGWHCVTCQTSYHYDKKCLVSKEKCPTCKKPMQAIDRSYPKVTLTGQALLEAPYLAGQTPAVPPIGITGAEWNLPIMSNLKGWEEQVMPAVKMANPSLVISNKGSK